MRRDRLLELLETIARGELEPTEALDQIAWAPIEEVAREDDELVFARVDHHRPRIQGIPEVVYTEAKSADQVIEICNRLAHSGRGFLATRTSPDLRRELLDNFPEARAHEAARIVELEPDEPPRKIGKGPLLIISAGTSDIPIAEEAAVTAAAFGNEVERLYDVGVAGIHRLLRESEALNRASVIIVVAGMEGALPSVVGGLVHVPVIAVPTSVGYGANFEGLAPLLGMLNSCAPGLTVVNIDNGFGAACAATRINLLID